MDFVNLRKTGNSWEFATEADLEDFVWANLKQLLGLTPLKRQYYVNGQLNMVKVKISFVLSFILAVI
ncbi:MAG: hypothetical protein KME52_16810 [Desmonostoc geniculatum HA4340-LM1]|jgi:hypothetical protein|nr:hypothetical protein [Desmonostoc geniculatum HA4340-LM1]